MENFKNVISLFDVTIILSTFTGALAGAIFTLLGIWLKELFDRKKEINNWFYNTYIEKGINPLIISLSKFQDMVVLPKTLRDYYVFDFPAEALAYTAVLIGNFDISLSFKTLFQIFFDDEVLFGDLSKSEKIKYFDYLQKLISSLYRLRGACIITSISSKKEAHNLDKKKEFKKLYYEIKQLTDQILDFEKHVI